jgi:hypothetical protein
LTIHFFGDNATQLKNSFDGSFAGSKSFRNAMRETARTYRNIYVGGSLEDLKDQPGFDGAEFNPNSEAARNTNAFGKTAGPETYFVVVTRKKHSLVQDGRQFVGSTDLSLVHELLHPSQIIRELTEGGHASPDSEPRTQMREQTIAQELGKKPGQDFPDVIGTGVPYGVQLDSSEAQPNSAPQRDPALPVDPMKYEGDTRSPVLRALEKYWRSAIPDGPAPTSAQGPLPATPASQPHTAGTGGVLGKFNWDSPIAPAEVAPTLAQGAPLLTPYFPGQASAFGDRLGNAPGAPSPDTPLRRVSSAFPGMTLPDPAQPVSPQPGRALGIFTGKPMPSRTTPPPLGGLLNSQGWAGAPTAYRRPPHTTQAPQRRRSLHLTMQITRVACWACSRRLPAATRTSLRRRMTSRSKPICKRSKISFQARAASTTRGRPAAARQTF